MSGYRITLDTVRQTLRQGLGRESFIAGFIRAVDENAACPTADITPDGQLRYNPDFVVRYVATEQDLFCLILHEILHPLFGHFVHGTGELENVGADFVINASVSLLYSRPSGAGSLFQKLYEPRGLAGLLRPESRMRDSRFARLYDAFYAHTWSRSSASLSTGEVIQTLKVLVPREECSGLLLLGSHSHRGGNGAGAKSAPRFAPDTLCRLAEDLRRAVDVEGLKRAGYGLDLHELFTEILKTHLSFRKALLQRFATQQKVDNFRRLIHRPRASLSPIPLHPSKRDLVLLAAGIAPFHYHNGVQAPAEKRQGLAVYLDVSGSVNQHLPHIIGLLQGLKQDLKSIFLFSNKVEEVPFATLLAGRIKTTYGTDFDCIAQSILDRGFDKAVILTDGYASMKPELAEALRKQRVCTLTVLFGGKMDCPEWAAFGEVVQLQDVTT